MSEQLYKLEKRGGEDGELVAGKIHLIGGVHVLYGTGHILVPVPEVHDLAWACGEMVRNPGVSYESGDEEDPVWFDEAKGNFWYQHRGNTEKVESWSINDLDSTSWRRVESKPAPQPGTLEWAREYVASGGSVWVDDAPSIKYMQHKAILEDGKDFEWPSRSWSREGCWHPWGDRAWLAALPDGTRVVHAFRKYVKRGEYLVTESHRNLSVAIKNAEDSGWDLVREPVTRYEPDAERMRALANEYLGTDDENRIETLESHVEQHDHLMADLAARLARLERKDGES